MDYFLTSSLISKTSISYWDAVFEKLNQTQERKKKSKKLFSNQKLEKWTEPNEFLFRQKIRAILFNYINIYIYIAVSNSSKLKFCIHLWTSLCKQHKTVIEVLDQFFFLLISFQWHLILTLHIHWLITSVQFIWKPSYNRVICWNYFLIIRWRNSLYRFQLLFVNCYLCVFKSPVLLFGFVFRRFSSWWWHRPDKVHIPWVHVRIGPLLMYLLLFIFWKPVEMRGGPLPRHLPKDRTRVKGRPSILPRIYSQWVAVGIIHFIWKLYFLMAPEMY